MYSGEMKARCIQALQELVSAFQQRKAAVTDDLLRAFMDPQRRLPYMDRFPKLDAAAVRKMQEMERKEEKAKTAAQMKRERVEQRKKEFQQKMDQ
jgi:hypothetical protein